MEKVWLKHYEPEVPPTIEYPEKPLHWALEEAARKYPDNTATIFMGAKLTYRELNELADKFAAALADLGVKKGDRVSVHLPNCPQFVVAYYGTLKAGGVIVPTNPLYVEREIEHQLNDSGAETIVTLTRFYPVIRRVKDRTKIRNLIVTNIKEYFPPLIKLLFTLFKEKKEGHRPDIAPEPGTYFFQDLLAKYPAEAPEVEVKPEDLALLQYTGGTTGVPKGAMLTHRNMLVNAIQVRNWMPELHEGGEVVLSALPFFHVYGMTVCMNMALYLGATMVLLPQFQTKDVLESIVKYKATLFPGVATMYVAINTYPEVSKYDISSIKACIAGAMPLPYEVWTRFEEITGGKLVEGYGLTEAVPVTHCNPIYGLRKPCIGIPFPDTEAKIVDLETGEKELPIGEVGELAIRGPQVMRGYWNMPEETDMVLKPDGWLLTGDIAKVDEDGYFYIVDRKKEMILSGGYNIYPRDIEEVLYAHPKVKEAAAVGIPDEYKGEVPKVFIVLKEGETATEEEIIAYCKENLAKYKIPKYVEFRKELPKTMVGKILRRVLAEEEKAKLAR